MALIECPECGQKVSDKAEKCINCGYPISNNKTEENISDSVTENNIENFSQLEVKNVKPKKL